jgi:hypothetical protein
MLLLNSCGGYFFCCQQQDDSGPPNAYHCLYVAFVVVYCHRGSTKSALLQMSHSYINLVLVPIIYFLI